MVTGTHTTTDVSSSVPIIIILGPVGASAMQVRKYYATKGPDEAKPLNY